MGKIGLVTILIIAAVFLVAAAVGIFMLSQRADNRLAERSTADESVEPERSTSAPLSYVDWYFDGKVWSPKDTPPACPEPLKFETPVNLELATGILWPGQVRGTDYKPHGGIRFDNSQTEDIVVRSPLPGYFSTAARYLQGGELQYTLSFIHPCGILFTFGHLRFLPPQWEEAVGNLPPAKEGDSRSYSQKPIFVEQGEIIATGVGFTNPKNVFVDIGVYDLRKKNAAAADPAWAAKRNPEKDHYSVCWLDWLPEADVQLLRSLSTGVEGHSSDFCAISAGN